MLERMLEELQKDLDAIKQAKSENDWMEKDITARFFSDKEFCERVIGKKIKSNNWKISIEEE